MTSRQFFITIAGVCAIVLSNGVLNAPAKAQGINAIGIAQQNFKNVSGAAADDFDVTFKLPAVGLGQDVATATKYPYATGTGATQHFVLNPTIANNQNFQLTYLRL